MFRYKCTIFRENKILVLNTNCHLKAVIYLFIYNMLEILFGVQIKH